MVNKLKETARYNNSFHRFFIPVMGTAFTIDTPLKVARFGISSVVSLCDDELCETMREFYCKEHHLSYTKIEATDEDARAKRITAYLNLLNDIVTKQVKQLKSEAFSYGNEIMKYFEMLPSKSIAKQTFNEMLQEKNDVKKTEMQEELRSYIVAGNIDVNIMTKLDKDNKGSNGEWLPKEYSDACAALRGFASSNLRSNIIFSAGFNRRLYAYCEAFDDFYPDAQGEVKKGIVLKVSDFRSSQIQGVFFAKKGLWVKEHRIESGLNCGGHAFATDGLMLGPILQEFKDSKSNLDKKLFDLCQSYLTKQNKNCYVKQPLSLLTVQGGLGTSNEVSVLQNYYQVDATGWGSPFLLVPEATTLHLNTRHQLAAGQEKDYYLSDISPLGVPFNTIKGTQSEEQKLDRARKGNPGSPCPKGFLKLYNTEFSKVPVCEASMFYQKRKLKELDQLGLNTSDYASKKERIIAKACLCEDLAASSLQIHNLNNKRPLKTAVCPGPNLAYFTKLSSLVEMVGHIYGKHTVLDATVNRPNMFFKEAKLYISYFEKELKKQVGHGFDQAYFNRFKDNMLQGFEYYKEHLKQIMPCEVEIFRACENQLEKLKQEFEALAERYMSLINPLTVN